MKKIKRLLQAFSEHLKAAIEGGDSTIRRKGEAAVKFTQAVKKTLESGVVRLIVEITPTDLDNKLLPKAQQVMAKVAFQVAIAHGLVQKTATKEEGWLALAEYLKALYPEARPKFWADFAAQFLIAAQDGKISWGDANKLTQMYYDEFYGKK